VETGKHPAITVIGQNIRIPDGAVIPAGAMVDDAVSIKEGK
jgi:acetyltransferase-like isoleucine patch superfamily enzyme